MLTLPAAATTSSPTDPVSPTVKFEAKTVPLRETSPVIETSCPARRTSPSTVPVIVMVWAAAITSPVTSPLMVTLWPAAYTSPSIAPETSISTPV